MRLGAWLVIIVAFIGLFYFHRWTLRTMPTESEFPHPAEYIAIKKSLDKVTFADKTYDIPADISQAVNNMIPTYVDKSRGVACDSDFASAQFGADNSELDKYFEKLRLDPEVYSFTPVPSLEDQQNPKTFQTELLANVPNLNPVPFEDGIVAYEDFDGTTYKGL